MKISDLIVLNALHTFNTCGEVLYRDKMKTALSAVLPKLMVTVKELEWMKSPLSSDIWLCVSYEEYKITRWWLDNSQDEIGHYEVDALDGEQFGTIEEAQLAAQAHFERSSLERMELVQSDVVSWPVAAQDMLSTWDRWLGTQNSTEDDRVQADILLKAACFAAQAYEDTIGGMFADKAPADLMKAFLIAIIDMNDPRLDQYRAGNRKNRPEPDPLTAETVIKKNGVDLTATVLVLSIADFIRQHGKAVLLSKNSLGEQILEFADAVRAIQSSTSAGVKS